MKPGWPQCQPRVTRCGEGTLRRTLPAAIGHNGDMSSNDAPHVPHDAAQQTEEDQQRHHLTEERLDMDSQDMEATIQHEQDRPQDGGSRYADEAAETQR